MQDNQILTASSLEGGEHPPFRTGRIPYIDLAKGICILLVVLNHLSIGGYFSGDDYPMNYIFAQVRMPLYFILSGLFFKDYQGGIREFLLRKVNRILVPYVFFLMLYKSAAWFVGRVTSIDVTDPGITGIWSPLWFLLCLFWMNVLFSATYYTVKHFIEEPLLRDITLGACVLLTGVAGYYVGNVSLYFGTAMTSLPFLWLGYLLNKRLKFFSLKIRWEAALLMGLLLLGVLHFTYMGKNLFFRNSYSNPLAILYLTGLMGTVGILLLSRVVRWLPVVSYVGRYSIIVLCTHMAAMKAVRGIDIYFIGNQFPAPGLLNSIVVFSLTVACCVVCCWVLSKYLPWFTAQKDLIKTDFGAKHTEVL